MIMHLSQEIVKDLPVVNHTQQRTGGYSDIQYCQGWALKEHQGAIGVYKVTQITNAHEPKGL
jgi:hypothetical protein